MKCVIDMFNNKHRIIYENLKSLLNVLVAILMYQSLKKTSDILQTMFQSLISQMKIVIFW